MESYKQMWMSLRNDLSMKIREYKQADSITGLNEYALTELDAWEGIMQEIEGLERQLEENNKSKENELINDMAETKRKAEAFDGINKLKDNIKFIKDVSLSHANEEPVNQEMYWVHSLMDSLLEELEANHEG
ncbi:hypothetical protein [Staphylococcus epidermidis]|uniref:hypothetical protein n=1 Tax=Staphylococcus epidermidis TaxID=1282 RepID=UPI0021B15DFA|nr:hypothetical protein [Staphylococcus epidermidis]